MKAAAKQWQKQGMTLLGPPVFCNIYTSSIHKVKAFGWGFPIIVISFMSNLSFQRNLPFANNGLFYTPSIDRLSFLFYQGVACNFFSTLWRKIYGILSFHIDIEIYISVMYHDFKYRFAISKLQSFWSVMKALFWVKHFSFHRELSFTDDQGKRLIKRPTWLDRENFASKLGLPDFLGEQLFAAFDRDQVSTNCLISYFSNCCYMAEALHCGM